MALSEVQWADLTFRGDAGTPSQLWSTLENVTETNNFPEVVYD